MDILLDIVHSVDYGVLAYISEHWRGGLSDTVWKVFSLLGSYGAVWITLAVLLLFFRRTRRAGAAMLIALGVGFLLGNVFLKNLVMRPRPFVTHTDLTALLVPGTRGRFRPGTRSARLRQLRRCTSSTIRPVFWPFCWRQPLRFHGCMPASITRPTY